MNLKGDQSTTRALNRRLILNCLRRQGDLSRVEMAELTGLSGAAVTGVTAELIEEGIVVEGGKVQGGAGRRPIPLRINYAKYWSIGFKLMTDRLEGTLTDLSTEPISTCSIPIGDTQPETVAEAARQGVDTLLGDRRGARKKLVGVGVAMPGLIDVTQGICVSSHRLGWRDVPIASLIASRIDVPVWVDNDTNAFAIAQHLFGAGRQRRSVLVLIIGTGVGAALIINGQIHRGARFAAGEIGFPVEPTEACIATESRLSWDRRLSERAMERSWAELCKEIPDAPCDLQEAAEAGHPRALSYLEALGTEIGARLAMMVDLVDPEIVIVGGEAVRFGKALMDPLIESVRARSFENPPPVEIDWDNDIWSRGAAVLAIQKFFDFESAAGVEVRDEAD
jgi:predicted NBD/HSP70 family sugar kinase